MVEEVCFDREYLYRVFCEHFCALVGRIYETGATAAAGAYTIPGVKSELEAELQWRLERRLTYLGPNQIEVACIFRDRSTGAATGARHGRFELATGAGIPDERGGIESGGTGGGPIEGRQGPMETE